MHILIAAAIPSIWEADTKQPGQHALYLTLASHRPPTASSLPASATGTSEASGRQVPHDEKYTEAMNAAGRSNEARLRTTFGTTEKPPRQGSQEEPAGSGSRIIGNRPAWMERLSPASSSSPDQFRVRHKLVTVENFERRKEKLKLNKSSEVWGDLRVDDMARMVDSAVTYDINNCTSIILTNGEKGSLGHFIPDEENLGSSAIEKAIHEDMEKLAEEGRPVSLLILGGDKENNASNRIYEKVKKSALTAGAKIVSEVWGRKEAIDTMENSDDEDADFEDAPRIRTLFDTKKRTNYIAIDSFDSIHSLKGIAYWYENFHIASPDVFEAQGKIYMAEEANSSVKKYKSEFKPGTIVPEEELNKEDYA